LGSSRKNNPFDRELILLAKFTRQHPLITFFCLAYAFSWVLGVPAAIYPRWPGWLTFLTVLGPAIAAIIVAGMVEGEDGVRQLLSPLKKWRVGIQWYVIVLLGPSVMMISSVYLYHLISKESGILESVRISSMLGSHFVALLIIFIYQFSIIWGEEIGWRGYALPRLQTRYHPILASIILGIIWGLWHLPSFWIEGSVHQSMSLPFFVLASVGYSILYTWIYNGSGGSLLLICMLHAANNTTVSYTMLFFTPILDKPVFSLAVLGLFDLLVILIAGPKLLWQPGGIDDNAVVVAIQDVEVNNVE
jgi:membrane protease YdiL (CAAX protease family)